MNQVKASLPRTYLVLGLRFVQLLLSSLFFVGLIWGLGDYLVSLLPSEGPVAPLSVLLMLYGVVGSLIVEAGIRIIERKK